MHQFELQLKQGLSQLNIQLEASTVQLLLDYLDALQLWNKAYNLTAIRDPAQMLVRHIFDSVSILPHLPAGRLLDIGTGGGMPGLIVAICQPERPCVLLDSNGKKIRFLTQFIADHQLKNVTAVHARVEDSAIIDTLADFSVLTSRAFSSLTDFVLACKPFASEHSVIAAMKGKIPIDEINRLTEYNSEIIQLIVPRLEEQRHLILLNKLGS